MSTRAVATPHRLSAAAGRRAFEAGGNAVDAAIAAIAIQGVVAPETCGLGGDLFALVHQPGMGRPRALNASGRAGGSVSAEDLRVSGHSAIPPDNPAAVTVPGCVDGLVALQELGRLSLAQNLGHAIELARDGFEVSTEQAVAFSRKADVYSRNPAVASFYPDSKPVAAGDRVQRTDLAETLEGLAGGGRDSFYLGTPGEDIVASVEGQITLDDMTRSTAEWIEPIGAEVAGLTAWTIPPNSQGYLGPATLAVFEMLSPPDDHDNPMWWHLLIEAYRCLAWERNDVIADPDHLAFPADMLLDTDRLARAALTVSRNRTGVWPTTGPVSGTAYICTADSDGLTVSVSQSNYRGTGSPFGAARSGFLLHDRGLGFSLMPGHPNELAPHKRPLHTLSPTLWTGEGDPRWALGTRGGSIQPQLVAQVAARAILGDEDLDSAQRAPRWAVADFGPGTRSAIRAEDGVSSRVLTSLRSLGHDIETTSIQPGWGPVSLIEVDGTPVRTARDPRVDTTAADVF